MRVIKLSLDDGDPLHLSIMPLLVFAAGVAAFCAGATFLALDLSHSHWTYLAILAASIVATAVGWVGMVREHMDQAAVLEEQRAKIEREAGI
jgi:hypothetical protein